MANNTKGKAGRPVGSLKPRTDSYKTLKFERQIEGVAVTKTNTVGGWVNWGIRNNYPDQLLALYANSPTHAACINFGVQAICGEGVDYEASNFDGKEVVPNYQQSWEQLIKSIALDYQLFGSYAIEVIRNKDGITNSYWHIPLHKVRWSEYDEDGQITSYFISRDWSALSKYPPIQLKAFDMRPDTKVIKGEAYLYVYRPYNPLQDYYTTPRYASALQAIQTEVQHINYDLKSTTNSFIPSGILTLSEVSTEDERRAIIDGVQSMFQGSDNANSVMINFQGNIEETAPKWTPLTNSSENFNLFAEANDRTVERILAAHQINDPQLIGLPAKGQGFNSEASLLETAFNVYNIVVGNDNRQAVIGTFNSMLKLNGVDTELVIKPLRFVTDNTPIPQEPQQPTEDDDVDASDYDENEVEEQQITR